MNLRFWSRVLLIGLILWSLAAPSRGAGIPLSAPDRRAIPMLVSSTRTWRTYGSGVVIGPTTVLTASHVAVADRIQLRFPSAVIAGRTICRARYEDLAVIRASLPKDSPYYRLSFRTPAVGDTVYVGGYPGRRWVVTRGRVTHLIRGATLSGRVVHAPMIVFSPALHQGASGSPVLDQRGQVVGIFVAANSRANYSIAFPIATALRACLKYVPENERAERP